MQDARVPANDAAAVRTASSWSSPPLDPFPEAAELLGPERLGQIVWAFIALGIAVRLIRYLLRLPLWPDEAYLAHNYLDRGYLDLTRPLDFIQIAPLLYLWVQETFVKVFGFCEYSLRLLPLLCGISSLFLFRHLAGRLLRGTALLVTVATFAVAYPLIRHSADAKPYGSDVFVTMVLLTLTVEWCRRPQSLGWWLALTLAMPVAELMSYPAVFVCGGIGVTMATVLWRRGSWQDWLRWGISGAALCAGFAAVFALSGGGQMAASGDAQRAAFADAFPAPGTSPLGLVAFLFVHTNRALCYPVGGNDWAPNLLNSLLCLTALFLLIRTRRLSLVVLCLTPLLLNYAAAVVKCYPYGDPWRLATYMAPVFCLLTGLGMTAFLAAITSHRAGTTPFGRRDLAPLAVTLVLLATIALGTSARDFLHPCKESCWMRNRDLARWFWCEKAEGAELVCLQNDLHQRFYTPPNIANFSDALLSVYFCNQRIYSARLAQGRPAQLDRVSASRPLRCVRFRPAFTTSRDEAAFGQWLKTMQSRYRLVAKERYPMSLWVNNDLKCVDDVELYEFVPNGLPR
jgi:4-amino-4-deoxy-L-arabinose transferase-like glycosyltransferase